MKIFHSEMPKRDWPNLRASYSASCRGLGFPQHAMWIRNHKHVREYNKRYLQERRDFLNPKQAEKARERRRQFPEQEREKSREQRRRNCHIPGWRMKDSLRTRIRMALNGTSKSANTIKLLGCSIVHFKTHLENLFRPGMNWKNYGSVWHVDHIKPCAKFNLTDPEEQKACFHWTNQQPLFAKENLQKGDKYDTAD